MDVALLCSIIVCIIGILTFITGISSRAKGDGAVVQKVDQALVGISELKQELREMKGNEQSLELLVRGHDEQIKLLRTMVTESNANTQALLTIMQILKDLDLKE